MGKVRTSNLSDLSEATVAPLAGTRGTQPRDVCDGGSGSSRPCELVGRGREGGGKGEVGGWG